MIKDTIFRHFQRGYRGLENPDGMGWAPRRPGRADALLTRAARTAAQTSG